MKTRLLLIVPVLACACEEGFGQTDSVLISTSGDTVVVWNLGVHANCAARFAFDITSETNKYSIVERDTVLRKVYCTCVFDLYAVLPGPSHAGTYSVDVFRQYLKLYGYPLDTTVFIGSAQFTIGAAGTVQYAVSYQSPCHTVVNVINTAVPRPGVFRLYDNYPNPFNPTTTIRYALPERSHVTLTVYNTLGQLATTLMNDEEPPGYHEVKFDGSNLASGVYFYRMQAGSFVATRKFLLLR
jgi:hypothetical protein